MIGVGDRRSVGGGGERGGNGMSVFELPEMDGAGSGDRRLMGVAAGGGDGLSCTSVFESPEIGVAGNGIDRSFVAGSGERRMVAGGGDRNTHVEEEVLSYTSVFDSPEMVTRSGGGLRMEEKKGSESDEELGSCSSSSTIGKNSDVSDGGGVGEAEEEVESKYKGPLDTMDALEEVLPIKKGISNFYNGKSKSFTSLMDASSSTMQDIVKPENAYTRKRKNLLAFSMLDKNRSNLPLRRSIGTKRSTNFSRSSVNLASMDSKYTGENSVPSAQMRPPLHPVLKPSPPKRTFSSLRSFSLADLHAAELSNNNSSSNNSSLISNIAEDDD